MKNGFCKISSWILAGVAAWGILAVLGEDVENIMRSTVATVVMMLFGTSTLACAAMYERGDNPGVSMTGLIACGIGIGYGVLIALGIFDQGGMVFLFVLALVVAIAMTHIGLLLMNDNENGLVRGVRNTTITCAAICYSLIGIAVLGSDEMDAQLLLGEAFDSEFMAKLLMISVMLMAVGTIITPMLNRIYNQEDTDYEEYHSSYDNGPTYGGSTYNSVNSGYNNVTRNSTENNPTSNGRV